jgi:hypothetical protein
MKVDKKWLTENYPCLQLANTFICGRSRPVIKCVMCECHQEDVKKYSVNGSLPIANGIPVYNSERLKLVIEHLYSKIHLAAVDIDKKEKQWNSQSDLIHGFYA